jgi:hypothetical protein
MAYINRPKISFSDSPSIDAFARARVSEPYTIFDSKMIHDNLPLFWDEQEISGAGTTGIYQFYRSSVVLSVSANTAGTRVRQTRRRFNYQPGKSMLIFETFTLGTQTLGVTKEVGYYDGSNGIFFRQCGNEHSFVVRSNRTGAPSDSLSAIQSDWNIDKFDGTGPSGITLDQTKSQIMIIDFEWLGVGRVRCGFVIDGLPYYAHQFLHANYLDGVYMTTPNLPLRYSISNDGTGTSASMEHICSTVISEGGVSLLGSTFSIDRGNQSFITLNDNKDYPLIAIRLKSDRLDDTVFPDGISVLCVSNSILLWKVVLNPIVLGTSLSFTGLNNSSVEYCNNTTNATSISGGTVLSSGYSQQSGDSTLQTNFTNALTIGSSISGQSDVMVLSIQKISNQTETFYGSMTVRQIA